MKSLYLLLLLLLGAINNVFSQTNYKTIASNRIIQKHHIPARIAKIAQIDSTRLQVLWNYFSNSFTYNSVSGISIQELLNYQHFDISEYEHLRKPNETIQIIYRGSIEITLKSGNELNTLLQGYDLNSLINNLPERSFPIWTSSTYTDLDFQTYKEQVWDWARDYPETYLIVTSNPNIRHISFNDLIILPSERRQSFLSTSNYIIID